MGETRTYDVPGFDNGEYIGQHSGRQLHEPLPGERHTAGVFVRLPCDVPLGTDVRLELTALGTGKTAAKTVTLNHHNWTYIEVDLANIERLCNQ